jgi:hypothetical protein
MLPRVAPADQVSGDVHHRPFGFSRIFIVTVRSRLRPFFSRTGGDSSVPHAARGPNRSILSRIASEDRLAPTALSANITWSRAADEVFRLAGGKASAYGCSRLHRQRVWPGAMLA